ncbi:hypothetical protein [Nannocystis pusilla]|uniref:hypothetical protein n=1 Tax=Nannocystis pusilla TaxID=889268 RepID=UPI003DA2A302
MFIAPVMPAATSRRKRQRVEDGEVRSALMVSSMGVHSRSRLFLVAIAGVDGCDAVTH